MTRSNVMYFSHLTQRLSVQAYSLKKQVRPTFSLAWMHFCSRNMGMRTTKTKKFSWEIFRRDVPGENP